MRTAYEVDAEREEKASATYVVAAEAEAAAVINDYVLQTLDRSPEEQS